MKLLVKENKILFSIIVLALIIALITIEAVC